MTPLLLVALILAADTDPDPTTGAAPAADEPTRLRLGMRLHPRYLVESEAPEHRFEVRRARLSLDLEAARWLEAQLDGDLVRAPAIRDAFVELRAGPVIGLRLGKFKRPFSRIELTSSGRLPLNERGIVNDLIVDDANFAFGGRDIGAALVGEAATLHYEVGVFNGSALLEETDAAKDVGARLVWTPAKAVEVGASGAFKWRADAALQRPRDDYWAAGLDTRLRLSRLELVGELLWGQSGRGPHRPAALGGTVYAVWRTKLSEALRLRPLVKVELLDQNVRRGDDLSLSALAGVNLHLGEYLRLMLQGQRIAPQPGADLPAAWRGVVELALDGKWDLLTAERRE